MKHAMLTAVALLALVSGEAFAACGEPYMGEADVKTLLFGTTGNTVCSPRNCSGASCEWQEQHRGSPGGGELYDYKKGTDPMDPTEKVGTWGIAGTGGLDSAGTVTHTYGSGTYVYSVKNNDPSNINNMDNYSFCGPNGEFTFSVKSGSVGC